MDPDPSAFASGVTTSGYSVAERALSTESLSIPECPSWCSGWDAEGESPACFRCWFNTPDAPTGRDLTIVPAPTPTADADRVEPRPSDTSGTVMTADTTEDERTEHVDHAEGDQ